MTKARLLTASPMEGMQVSLAAMKSIISDYALRTRQAEEIANTLLSEVIPKETMQAIIVNTIKRHSDTRELERSTQYLGIIQVTLMALTSIHRRLSIEDELNSELLEIIKALTVASN